MADFKLYCFGESGNAYKAALMLELCRLKWQPVWVDFFNGETRSAEYRANVNEMGEAPVLIHGATKLTQSGVILDYLAELTRKFGAKSDAERREIWRWMLFDNHKLTANLATLRFLIRFAKSGETPVTEFLRNRAVNALKIVDLHLANRHFIIGKRATIADLSLAAYLFYGEELTLPLDVHTHVLNWLDRIRALPGWKHPYDLMPRTKI
ncbi:MAG: glutathione S-transferase N-terminal domain-containing protein [Rhizobiales bacterium]|nr:glutathione S-transferase N-terminal domain-containing protein [Hyphomicrobiales bacterium]MBI3673808.1 glutathione S-transferase N-terminal domain-containing protein [Hyphomicrobiales bacterium]